MIGATLSAAMVVGLTRERHGLAVSLQTVSVFRGYDAGEAE